ncbi:hypothetical protein [Haloferax sp. DFSO60]|uniref:hypothetical protein n=1 Tax=Haloferax sp. DFSO60 TaxID=3388652 RepID=UPI003979E2A5
MSDSPPEKSHSDDEEDGGDLWFTEDVDNSELAQANEESGYIHYPESTGYDPVYLEEPQKPKSRSDPVCRPLHRGDSPHQVTMWDREITRKRPPYEKPGYDIQDSPSFDPPEMDLAWRLVKYRCASCHNFCLVDHAEQAAKYHECRSCARIPAADQKIRDHRLTSLLWAHLAARDSTARTGEATNVLPALSAPKRGSEEPAGSDPSRGDPEASPHEADGRRPRTWVGAVGSPSKAVSTPEETQQRLSDYAVPDGGERE